MFRSTIPAIQSRFQQVRPDPRKGFIDGRWLKGLLTKLWWLLRNQIGMVKPLGSSKSETSLPCRLEKRTVTKMLEKVVAIRGADGQRLGTVKTIARRLWERWRINTPTSPRSIIWSPSNASHQLNPVVNKAAVEYNGIGNMVYGGQPPEHRVQKNGEWIWRSKWRLSSPVPYWTK